MKNRKNSPVSFGITLTSNKQTRSKNSDRGRAISTGCRENILPATTEQVSIHEFDCPRTKMPAPDKPPFTPDMFTCESVPLPAFPQPWKMSPKEERVQKELKHFRSRKASPRLRARTAWYPASKKSPMALSVPWGFFKVICIGVFVALKYAFIAVALIITIGCMICAGRQTGGLK